jgi:N-acetylglutamate synthase-like GNAT family acetyltransferase
MKTPEVTFADAPAAFALRHDLKPGDLGRIVSLHGTVCASEYGFDSTFEASVASLLAEFVHSRGDYDRLWIAERGDHLAGCAAIIGLSLKAARLRWLLVDPPARGLGLGRTLLEEVVSFSQHCGYERLFFWTIRAPEAVVRLYRSVGFEKIEERSGERWGVEVVEEQYALRWPERSPGSASKRRPFRR